MLFRKIELIVVKNELDNEKLLAVVEVEGKDWVSEEWEEVSVEDDEKTLMRKSLVVSK